MPKILNLTIEEKAERYSKLRKGAVHLTIEERAVKWDEYVKIRSGYNMGYASRNKEKSVQISKDHYEANKTHYNNRRCIDAKENRGIYTQYQRDRRQKIRDLKMAGSTENTDKID